MSFTEEFQTAVKKAVAEALAKQGSQAVETHSTMQAIDDCVGCRGRYKADEFKTKVLQKAWQDRKDSSMQCRKCKFPVRVHDRDGNTKENEDDSCPLCGSKNAEDRY